MCVVSNTFLQAHNLRIKLTRLRLLRLTRRSYKKQKGRVGKDMVVKNLKLYMKNISIREENEKLRSQASALHQENLALMSEFRKRFSNNCDVGSMPTNIVVTTLPNQQC